MKLLDEKLVEEAAKRKARYFALCGEIKFDESDIQMFKYGVSFAEQQLKEKMIEFGNLCQKTPRSINGLYWKNCKEFTTEQLLEQFLNKE